MCACSARPVFPRAFRLGHLFALTAILVIEGVHPIDANSQNVTVAIKFGSSSQCGSDCQQRKSEQNKRFDLGSQAFRASSWRTTLARKYKIR